VDVGFIDEVVAAEDVLERAVAIASELATTLDPSAYQRTIAKMRGPVLDLMAEQIASDRAAGRSPL
jgi:enoyl-CoA hydratase/carnithine racemase